MKKLIALLCVFALFSFAMVDDDTVTFTAKIENRNGDSLIIKGANRFTKIIVADKNGVFKDKFAVAEGFYQLSDGTEYTQLYLKNGYDLTLTMDAKEFDESIKYSGKGSEENNFIAQMALEDEQMDFNTLLNSPEDKFSAIIEKKKSDVAAKLEGNKKLGETFVNQYKSTFEQNMKALSAYYEESQKVKKLNGKPSPTFDYENHKGGKTKLEDLKGKLVYIDVWATWCGPCRAEIPHLKELEKKYHGKNIAFVSISVDALKDHDKWKKFVTDKELGGIQLFADDSWKSDFVTQYQINGIPRFILVGKNGEIINADAPRPSSADVHELLDTNL
ncbi:TlpA family protein disulfide reductase [Flavobacterium sp. NRK F10]|uniref:TlpA family protein disulfide reductase n=1 Tax=Flavobacterium sediminis TaxID=2201181 RepID=A0A2U8QUG0_9FLAO|nr:MULTISPECIES: TlpA disulfide reductase family protein [Flavobacterium]AWM13753.1 TlpA family protein disulfide reductase [Flavobacterium sediminis]MCO6174912.1 TlpA family protein disulfide reductase [Flavobacterium sp. NRK F10]